MTADWKRQPKAGTRWRSRLKPIETRTVVDRTLYGHVIYVVGRRTRFNLPITSTFRNWLYWKSKTKAKRIDNADQA